MMVLEPMVTQATPSSRPDIAKALQTESAAPTQTGMPAGTPSDRATTPVSAPAAEWAGRIAGRVGRPNPRQGTSRDPPQLAQRLRKAAAHEIKDSVAGRGRRIGNPLPRQHIGQVILGGQYRGDLREPRQPMIVKHGPEIAPIQWHAGLPVERASSHPIDPRGRSTISTRT